MSTFLQNAFRRSPTDDVEEHLKDGGWCVRRGSRLGMTAGFVWTHRNLITSCGRVRPRSIGREVPPRQRCQEASRSPRLRKCRPGTTALRLNPLRAIRVSVCAIISVANGEALSQQITNDADRTSASQWYGGEGAAREPASTGGCRVILDQLKPLRRPKSSTQPQSIWSPLDTPAATRSGRCSTTRWGRIGRPAS